MIRDLHGCVFGRLTVLAFHGMSANHKALWSCRCACGMERVVLSGSLMSGKTVSCGCFKAERLVTFSRIHGLSHTGAYQSWKDMMGRCYRPKVRAFKDYGGRGIRVCKRWHRFEAFFRDMGDRPSGLEIDRVDVNGSYCPKNCRWSDEKTQALNKRGSRVFYDVNCKRISMRDIGNHLAINSGTLWGRFIAAGVMQRRDEAV